MEIPVRTRLLRLPVAFAFFACSFLAPVVAEEAEPAPTLDDPDVLAIINGTAVTKDLFGSFLQQRLGAAPGDIQDPQQQFMLLNELVNYILISQEAVAQGLDKTARGSIALELARTQVLTELAITEFAAKNPITQADLDRVYKERFGRPMREYKARHILLETEEDAKKVIAELAEGGDFEKLAKSRSTGPSAPQGGDLGWFDPSQMVKPFANAVAALEDGKYSEAPVQTRFGWHVILREESRKTDPPTYEEVKDQLQEERRRELLGGYVGQLREKAKIQARGPSPAPAPAQ